MWYLPALGDWGGRLHRGGVPCATTKLFCGSLRPMSSLSVKYAPSYGVHAYTSDESPTRIIQSTLPPPRAFSVEGDTSVPVASLFVVFA